MELAIRKKEEGGIRSSQIGGEEKVSASSIRIEKETIYFEEE